LALTATARRLQAELSLGGGDGGDEGFWRLRLEEAGAISGILEDFAERAHDGEVVAGFCLRGAEDEEQTDDFAFVVEGDAGVGAADGEDDFLYVLGAGVRERDAVAETGGVEPV